MTAYTKSWDMGKKNYFAHEYKGKRIWEYKNVDRSKGENIAMREIYYKGTITESQAKDLANVLFEQWKESPGHNRNMLFKDYKYIEFDLYLAQMKGNSGYYNVYATQEFK